jgi:hypothetical protein
LLLLKKKRELMSNVEEFQWRHSFIVIGKYLYK